MKNSHKRKKRELKTHGRSRVRSSKFAQKIFLGTKKKHLCIFWTVILVGIAINYTAKNEFPYFSIIISLLGISFRVTFYTSAMIHKAEDRLQSLMAGDQKLLELKTNLANKSSSKNIAIPVILFSITGTIAALGLLGLRVDTILKFYCFSCLFLLIAFCTYGAIQYLLLICFAHKVQRFVKAIKKYDEISPQRTPWLEELSIVIHRSNGFFLLVGLLLIVAFSIFSFSGQYNINMSTFLHHIFLWFYWIVIIIFIIMPAIVFTYLSNHDLSCIRKGLTANEIQSLKKDRKLIFDKQLKNDYAIRIMMLQNLESADKHFSRVISYALTIIDAAASLQALLSLANVIPKDFATNLLSLFR